MAHLRHGKTADWLPLWVEERSCSRHGSSDQIWSTVI